MAAFFVTFKDGWVNFDSGSATTIAALYALGAAACWGIGTTLSKLLLNQVKSLSATILRFYGSTFLALFAVQILGSQTSLGDVNIPDITRLIYIAFTTGLLAMVLYYRGLKHTQVKTATILELALPVMAILIDMVVYHTFLAPSQYLAAVVLMYAMTQVSRLNTASATLFANSG